MSIDNQLIDFAHLLNQQNDFQEILRIVVQKSMDFLEAAGGSVQMLNPRTRQTVKTLFRGGAELSNARYSSLQNQVSGWMLASRKAFLADDISKDSRFKEANFEALPIRSVAGVRLQVEGIVLGCLIVFSGQSEQRRFNQADVDLLKKLAVLSAPYLRNAHRLHQLFDRPVPEDALLRKYAEAGLLGKSNAFVELLHSIEAAAHCDVRVMLEGRSGTGKELIARAIHLFSSRNQGLFVAIDCGAIPDNLFESELFGVEKGAFTGASRSRVGLIEEANGGTLFIDEIANLPLEMQAKLMRVLQENAVRPIGTNKISNVDVRIISASSRSLKELVGQKLFREDLFYRLYVYPIRVPELSEREGDVAILADHFLRKHSAIQSKTIDGYHEALLDFIRQRVWNGNIRELENFVERLVTLTPSGNKSIGLDLVPPDLKSELESHFANNVRLAETRSFGQLMLEHEEEILRQALTNSDWNQSRAAQSLRMSEQNLRYRMKKLGIKRLK